ncbi:MAG: pentapeptide repeat-containing protein [Pseudonocardiaceae bacterium]
MTLADTALEDVDLSNASIQRATARRVEMLRCRAIGLRLSIEQAADLYVEGCRLDFAVIHIEKIKGIAAFVGCSFRETVISGCLSGVVFLDCDFTDTEFEAASAKGCDLRMSRLAGARGLLNLRGALITVEQAVSVAHQLATETGLIIQD